jgi:hypothetical protein
MSKPDAADNTGQAAVAPSACPFCHSVKVTTPTAKIDASTYWRCETCGEMWNVERLHLPNRGGYRLR